MFEYVRGKFICFDGPDGCGKSTQLSQLKDVLETEGIGVTKAKDPGGTAIGDQIRHILLNSGHSQQNMDVRCETFLFMASRAQLAAEVIDPALKNGGCVLCDRFVSSTLAYQAAGGYPAGEIIKLARYAIGNTWPDLTIILDVTVDAGFSRAGRKRGLRQATARGGEAMLFDDATVDSMERRTKKFHEKARKLFLSLPKEYPGQVRVIDGHGEPALVHERVLEAVSDALGSD